MPSREISNGDKKTLQLGRHLWGLMGKDDDHIHSHLVVCRGEDRSRKRDSMADGPTDSRRPRSAAISSMGLWRLLRLEPAYDRLVGEWRQRAAACADETATRRHVRYAAGGRLGSHSSADHALSWRPQVSGPPKLAPLGPSVWIRLYIAKSSPNDGPMRLMRFACQVGAVFAILADCHSRLGCQWRNNTVQPVNAVGELTAHGLQVASEVRLELRPSRPGGNSCSRGDKLRGVPTLQEVLARLGEYLVRRGKPSAR